MDAISPKPVGTQGTSLFAGQSWERPPFAVRQPSRRLIPRLELPDIPRTIEASPLLTPPMTPRVIPVIQSTSTLEEDFVVLSIDKDGNPVVVDDISGHDLQRQDVDCQNDVTPSGSTSLNKTTCQTDQRRKDQPPLPARRPTRRRSMIPIQVPDLPSWIEIVTSPLLTPPESPTFNEKTLNPEENTRAEGPYMALGLRRNDEKMVGMSRNEDGRPSREDAPLISSKASTPLPIPRFSKLRPSFFNQRVQECESSQLSTDVYQPRRPIPSTFAQRPLVEISVPTTEQARYPVRIPRKVNRPIRHNSRNPSGPDTTLSRLIRDLSKAKSALESQAPTLIVVDGSNIEVEEGGFHPLWSHTDVDLVEYARADFDGGELSACVGQGVDLGGKLVALHIRPSRTNNEISLHLEKSTGSTRQWAMYQPLHLSGIDTEWKVVESKKSDFDGSSDNVVSGQSRTTSVWLKSVSKFCQYTESCDSAGTVVEVSLKFEDGSASFLTTFDKLDGWHLRACA